MYVDNIYIYIYLDPLGKHRPVFGNPHYSTYEDALEYSMYLSSCPSLPQPTFFCRVFT